MGTHAERMNIKWKLAQDAFFHPQEKHKNPKINMKYHNGTTWSKHLIIALQTIAYDTWQFRNKDIHGH